MRRPLIYLIGLRSWGRSLLGFCAKRDEVADLLSALPPVGELMAQFSDRRLFEQYPIQIDPEDPQLRMLRSLVETSSAARMKVLFYVTPIHLEEMRRREPFDETSFNRSVRTVTTCARSDWSACIDLSSLLGENDFIDCFEHYSPRGNRLIAHSLAPEAARLLGIQAGQENQPLFSSSFPERRETSAGSPIPGK